MSLFKKMPLCLIISGLLFAWLARAQTETVYLTQIHTIYTACECFGTMPASLSSLFGPSSPAIVSTGASTTLTGTFPSFSASSTNLAPGPMSSLTSNPLVISSVSAATVASVVSLSNGLGPLLSLDTSKPALWSSASLLSSTLTGTRSTSIQVISSTIAPTAASSALTTSGVPGSLSITLSLVSSNTALETSAALISFGTSSPAVFSTVLPSGMSMGTSSLVLATHSTIALSSISLTGVTLLAPRSPTSCFTLPTPAASMDMVAVAVVPVDDFDLSNPVIIALGDNGTTPQYVSAMASGNPYVLNLSPNNPITGQLGLQIPGEDALVFDGSGMSLYTGNCTSVTQVLVENFYHQLGSIAGRKSPRGTTASLREGQSPSSSIFNVQVAVDNYLKTPSFSPNLTFGDAQCTFQSSTMGSTTYNMTWSCNYPPPTGGVVSCASSLDTWLNDATAPSTSPGNTTEVLATIGPFLSAAGDSILDLFPGSDPALSLGFIFMQQAEAAARTVVGSVGSSACEVVHVFDSDDLVMEDSGPLGTQTLGSFMTAPPPSVGVNLAAAATQAITALPPRKANPKDNFLKQIVTDFKAVVGAFTHWLHGLPLLGGLFPPHDILDSEAAGNPPLAAISIGSTITVTSTATLSTSSVVRVKMPTITVTHVLGDGWLSPSTYIVGPGTSTIPQFPAIASLGSEVASGSAGSTSVSLEEYAFGSWSSSSAFASSHVVDNVMSQLAAMADDGAGGQTVSQLDWPAPAHSSKAGTTTTGIQLGYDGHIVLVTTTITLLNATSAA